MKQFIFCRTGNGDPPPKKPPTEQPQRRKTDGTESEE